MKEKLKSLISFICVCLFMVLGYQNCGDVGLIAEDASSSVLLAKNPTYLKVPENQDARIRVAFLVDMSHSMISVPCPQSIDKRAVSTVVEGPCNQRMGLDDQGNRFKVMRSWLTKAQEALALRAQQDPNYNPDDVFRVMIVPFSGGESAYEKFYQNFYTSQAEAQRYKTIDDALRTIEKLQFVQDEFFGQGQLSPGIEFNWNQGMSQNSMLTSVPKSGLDLILSGARSELGRIPSALLNASRFEFVFISDGVPKPVRSHIKATADVMFDALRLGSSCGQCSEEFATMLEQGRTWVNGSCSQCIDTLTRVGLTNEAGDSTGNLLSNIAQHWGNVAENTQLKIFQTLNGIRDLFSTFSGPQHRFSFLMVENLDPERKNVLAEDTTNTNWMRRAKLSYAGVHRHAVINSDRLPFKLVPGFEAGEAYRIGYVFATNVQTRLDSFGRVRTDSDADGVFDDEEANFGFNATNPRSNGVCLDGVNRLRRGCITNGCVKNLDRDGDGLSECDEKTLGTSDVDFDSDDDGIPDSMELIYGFNPTVSDVAQDSNRDQTSNLVAFQMGMSPLLNPASAELTGITRLNVQSGPYKPFRNSIGQNVFVAGYQVDLMNIPVKVSLSTMEAKFSLKRSLTGSTDDNQTHLFVGFAMPVNANKIRYVVRVDNARNPGESYWYSTSVNLSASEGINSEIDLSQLQQLDVLDPIGGNR